MIGHSPTDTTPLAARHRPNHEKRFVSRDHGRRERCFGIVVRNVFFAGVETDEGATPLGSGVSNRSQQYRVATFQSVEHRTLAGDALNFELDLATFIHEGLQMSG